MTGTVLKVFIKNCVIVDNKFKRDVTLVTIITCKRLLYEAQTRSYTNILGH